MKQARSRTGQDLKAGIVQLLALLRGKATVLDAAVHCIVYADFCHISLPCLIWVLIGNPKQL
jgi:hypothetical protein